MVSTAFRVCSTLTLLICVAQTANARPIPLWPYDQLFRESNLAVIAEAVRSQTSKDVFPDANPWQLKMEGIVTVFRVELVLKGKEAAKEIRVLHFKIGQLPKDHIFVINDGPCFVKFATDNVELTSKDLHVTQKPNYLLFLKKMADGRYEAVTGQTDPEFSVREMYDPIAFHHVLQYAPSDFPKHRP
jgi:hypothetical protein